MNKFKTSKKHYKQIQADQDKKNREKSFFEYSKYLEKKWPDSKIKKEINE